MSSWVMLGNNGCNKGTLWPMANCLQGYPALEDICAVSWWVNCCTFCFSQEHKLSVYYMWLTLCSRLTPFPPSPHFLPRKETQDGSGSIVWKEEDSRRDAQTKPKSTQQGQSNHVHIFTCGEAGSVAKNLIPSPLHLTLARYLFTFFFFMFSINRWYGNSTGSVPAWSVRRKS